MQMEQDDNFKNLINNVEEYFTTQKNLTKLHIVEKVSVATSAAAANLIIFMIFLMMFLFLNLAIAYIISEYTGKIYIGFAAVCIIYLITGILIYVNRDSWLKAPITNSIINKILNHE